MVAEAGKSNSLSALVDAAGFITIVLVTILLGMFLRTTFHIPYAASTALGVIAIFSAFRLRRRRPIARIIIWFVVTVYSVVALLFALIAMGVTVNGGL